MLNSVLVDGHPVYPSKIICVGRNYMAHIEELNNEKPDEMVLFLKPNSAISDQLNWFHQEQLHYEGELCFVYQQGRFSAIGFGLDLTKRSLQSQLKAKGLPWERAKAFNGSAVFSKFTSCNEIADDLSFQLNINGQARQMGNLELMIYKPQQILAEISQFLTLNDGDIVMSGTPQGVGAINQQDIFEAQVFAHQQLIAEAQFNAG